MLTLAVRLGFMLPPLLGTAISTENDLLLGLMTAVPDDLGADMVPRFSSLHEACLAGVEGEIDNAAMYDRLIEATSHADLVEVFENDAENPRGM